MITNEVNFLPMVSERIWNLDTLEMQSKWTGPYILEQKQCFCFLKDNRPTRTNKGKNKNLGKEQEKNQSHNITFGSEDW